MVLTVSSRHLLISCEVYREQGVLFPRPSGICWVACLHPAVCPWASHVPTPGLLFLVVSPGGWVRAPSALCLSRALKFLDSSGAKSRPQWQSTHGKPLRWMSGAIVIVKIEQASELWPEHNESHFCRTAMMTGDQPCSRGVDVASPFGLAPFYNR